MPPEAFRRLAMALPGVRETQVLGAWQYRLRGWAFATIGWPESGWAVVWLSVSDQARFRSMSVAVSPDVRVRSRRGVTRLRLDVLDESLAEAILGAAWNHLTTSFPAPEVRPDCA